MRSIMDLRHSVKEQAHDRNTEDRKLRIQCLEEACQLHKEGTTLEKMVEYFSLYDQRFIPLVVDDLYFAGTPGYYALPESVDEPEIYRPRMCIGDLVTDIGHYCANYQRLLNAGIEGIRGQVMETESHTEEEAAIKQAYLKMLDLFTSYMKKHAQQARLQADKCQAEAKRNLIRMAQDIEYICEHRPMTLMQGMQLIFFAHTYIYLKPYTGVVTFGNLDRVFEQLYTAGITDGTLNRDFVREMICHFYIALSSMYFDTQNIAVGGSDKDGNYFENDLTVLFIEAQKIVHLEQPSVCVKIRPDTSDKVWQASLDLLATGGGMPAFLNDPLIIRSLVHYGFSQEEANTFCNVGCYEATPYGNTFGGTTSGEIAVVQLFVNFFFQDIDYESYDDFLKAWEKFFLDRYLTLILPTYAKRREDIRIHSASPFLGLLMDGCIDNLKLPEQFGAEHNIYAVNLGGIGTLTDSLLCVKHFVYDTKTWTLSELRHHVAENYPDESVRTMLRNYPNRFGSGDPYSVELARREALLLADIVTSHPFDERIQMLPALFYFKNDITTAGLPPTPDGRRLSERYSYGAAASEILLRRDTTKILLSSAELPLDLFPMGAPMTVNLAVEFLNTEKGRSGVRTMVETFLAEGGFHIQINLADANVLRDAQKKPEKYKDLLIRTSGHTETFINLSKIQQDALIERVEMGC